MSTLPNLSTWHPVPVGATIPKGTPYAYDYGGGPIVVESDGYRFDTVVTNGVYYYTERPVPLPLPTEQGATIVASADEGPPNVLLTRVDDHWATCYGACWYDYKIVTWAPVTIGEVASCTASE